jgi:hypothetical protein
MEAFSDVRLWWRSPCWQRTQDVGFLVLFIKPNSKPFIEHFSSFTGTSFAHVFVVLNRAHMTTSHPKVSLHGIYPEPQSIIPHFQVHCSNFKKNCVITKFCITVLTLETLSQFATKLCVGRIHPFLKKEGDSIITTWQLGPTPFISPNTNRRCQLVMQSNSCTIHTLKHNHFNMFVSIKPLHVSVFFHDHLQGVLRCALCRYYSS